MRSYSLVRIFTIALLISSSAQALDVQIFHPTVDQTGGFVVYGSDTLPKNRLRTGVSLNYVLNPIEFGDTTNDSRVDELVGWFMTTNFTFADAITDRFVIGLDIPLNLGSRIEPATLIVEEKKLGIGDVRLYGKYQFREKVEGEYKSPGLAILPFLSLPTGEDSDFFGEDTVIGGFKFIADWMLTRRNYLAMNLGPRIRKSETNLNLTVGSELLAGISYQYAISLEHHLNFVADLYGSTTFSRFMSQEISSPLETLLGIQKTWSDNHWNFKGGFGRGMNNGYGAPDVRVFAMASYVWGGKKKEEPKQEPQPLPAIVPDVTPPVAAPSKVKIQDSKIVFGEKIYFEPGKGAIQERSFPILLDVANVLKANPQVKKVRIEGHTDSMGSDVANMKLSQLRADNVRKFLMDSGIEAGRVDSVGYGESKPIVTNATVQGREANRRVEISIVDE